MEKRFPSSLIAAGIACLFIQAGCGGPLAKTGCAVVTDVACHGVMRMHYPDGRAEWKRINRDNVTGDTRTAEKNRLKPARFVETRNGGTLTFPDGDTVTYHDPQ